eukprot:9475190-Pyramimonas_sp.AAC.1
MWFRTPAVFSYGAVSLSVGPGSLRMPLWSIPNGCLRADPLGPGSGLGQGRGMASTTSRGDPLLE